MSRGTPERAGLWTAFVDHVAQGGSGSASPRGSRRWLPPGWRGGGLALASSTVPVPQGPLLSREPVRTSLQHNRVATWEAPDHSKDSECHRAAFAGRKE